MNIFSLKKKYKVVRTYDEGKTRTAELEDAFKDGYEFVRASEFIPSETRDGVRRFGYIEYILVKEVGDE